MEFLFCLYLAVLDLQFLVFHFHRQLYHHKNWFLSTLFKCFLKLSTVEFKCVFPVLFKLLFKNSLLFVDCDLLLAENKLGLFFILDGDLIEVFEDDLSLLKIISSWRLRLLKFGASTIEISGSSK